MTDKEILFRSIKKAFLNGYDIPYHHSDDNALENLCISYVSCRNWHEIIFSHHFAKSFWGEKSSIYDKNRNCLHCGVHISLQPKSELDCNHIHYPENCKICSSKNKDWQYHLQQMVIKEEPLKYLESFLNEN